LPEPTESQLQAQEELEKRTDFSQQDEKDEEKILGWLNSLSLPKPISKLTEDLRYGTVILQILLKAVPESEKLIDPKKLNANPGTSIFKRAELCKYVLDIVIKLSAKIKIPTLSSSDIVEGKSHQIMALVNHIRKLSQGEQSKKVVQQPRSLQKKKQGDDSFAKNMFLSGRIKTVTEEDTLAWFNNQMEKQGKAKSSLSEIDLLSLFNLLKHLAPSIVDASLITPNSTDKERLMNAQYVMGITWKLGIEAALHPRDLIENPKSIQTYLSVLLIHYTLSVKLS